jgi:hypothetical protein
MTFKLGIRVAVSAAACVGIAMPLLAHAVGPVTGHLLSMSIRGVSQTTNSKDEDRPRNTSVNAKDVFAGCTSRSPTKSEGVYLFLDCSDLTNNMIAAIDTNRPLDTARFVGTVGFDLTHAVDSSRKGVLQSKVVPVTVEVACDGGAFLEASGIMTIKYSALGSSPACPLSASVKITGIGYHEPPGDFIANTGSSITAKKRSGAITAFPPVPF